MKVFKFGGASVNNTQRIEDLAALIRLYANEKILIVISAMGKTTNALENVVHSFCAGEKTKALDLFEAIKASHLKTFNDLTQTDSTSLQDFFTEVEWLLHDKPVRSFDYYYDQIVSIGELMSTALIHEYFNFVGIKCSWVDVRDILRTDNNFRDATVDFTVTKNRVEEALLPKFEATDFVITQGFIGSTDENESTTLGREGSDYSAAIFANILNAESQTIWKDVHGVMNADPKEYSDAVILSHLNYDEVIEMAYYGAQVIHPKTIKPLHNKKIPLLVKCFLDKNIPGTVIDGNKVGELPAIKIDKKNQVLLKLSSKDFSFVGEDYIGQFYKILAENHIKPNLIQTTAISILCCLDDNLDKIEKLALAASLLFDVIVEKDLSLHTIRHYETEGIEQFKLGKQILLEQKTESTVQFLYRN